MLNFLGSGRLEPVEDAVFSGSWLKFIMSQSIGVVCNYRLELQSCSAHLLVFSVNM